MDFVDALEKISHFRQVNFLAALSAFCTLGVIRFILAVFLGFFLLSLFKKRLIKIDPNPWPKRMLFRDFILSFYSILIFKFVNVASIYTSQYGLSKVYFKVSDFGIPYLLTTLFFNLIFFDAYFYCTHRFLHRRFMMKHVHQIHHECHNLSILSAYAFHPVEAFIYPWGIVILSFIIPMHIAVFGFTQLFILIQNMTIHCGYSIYPASWARLPLLKYIMQPIHHDDHHNHHPRHNYGFFTNIWDRAMGTYRHSKLDS
ncbi:MAG: sterol desaturase family protein [Gammaproteobacteria bacterium]